MTKRLPIAAALLTSALTFAVRAQAPQAIVPAVVEAAKAMGVTGLQSIQYSGTGSMFLVGQAPSPGGPWPRFELAKYVASVDYTGAAMREETVRRDVEFPPRGGGAGPFNPATGQGGMRPIPGDVVQTLVRDGSTEAGAVPILMTPHGFLKAALSNPTTFVTSRTSQGRTLQVVVFGSGGRTVGADINDQHLVERIGTTVPNSVLGSMAIEAVFSDYKDYGGVKFPTRILQSQGGHPTLDLTVTGVRPNGAAAVTVPRSAERPPVAPPPVHTDVEKIADGVFFLTGGAPMSVLVEFRDHLVIIEAPQDDARSEATIAAVRRLMPTKPIRYLVNTHHHFDHSGGLGGYLAEGIPIITHERNKSYFEGILRRPGRRAVIETVGARRVLSDDTMTLELHHLDGNLHAETLLVAYLPRQKLLVQADAFHPRPGAPPLASPPPFTVNLVENIRRLKLDVERVVHVHGGIDSIAAVVKAAGK